MYWFLLNASDILTLGLQLEMRTPASNKQWWPGGRKIVEQSRIDPTIFKSKSFRSYSRVMPTDSSNGIKLKNKNEKLGIIVK